MSLENRSLQQIFLKVQSIFFFSQTLINFCQIKSVILMWLMRPCRRWLKSLVSSQWHSYYSLTLGQTSSKGYCFFFRYVCSWRLSTYFSGRVFMVSCCSTSVRCNEYLNWKESRFLHQGPRRLRLTVWSDQTEAELSGVPQGGGSGDARPHISSLHGNWGRPRHQSGGSVSSLKGRDRAWRKCWNCPYCESAGTTRNERVLFLLLKAGWQFYISTV